MPRLIPSTSSSSSLYSASGSWPKIVTLAPSGSRARVTILPSTTLALKLRISARYHEGYRRPAPTWGRACSPTAQPSRGWGPAVKVLESAEAPNATLRELDSNHVAGCGMGKVLQERARSARERCRFTRDCEPCLVIECREEVDLSIFL